MNVYTLVNDHINVSHVARSSHLNVCLCVMNVYTLVNDHIHVEGVQL